MERRNFVRTLFAGLVAAFTGLIPRKAVASPPPGPIYQTAVRAGEGALMVETIQVDGKGFRVFHFLKR